MSEQKKSNHPALPRLKPTHQVRNFNAAGEWDYRDRTELEKVSEGLKVEKIKIEINSIPDMWARPLLFEMALYDSSHLLHQRVIGEWRGLLTMIGLREVAGLYELTIAPIKISGTSESHVDESGEPQPPDFLKALSRLIPDKSLATDTTWTDLYVLLFRGRPIGLTSPTTLVATATDCFNRINNVPWFDGRHLTDPIKTLPVFQKEALASWLNLLKTNLSSHKSMDKAAREWNALLGLLNAFIEDLGGVPEQAIELSTRSLNMQAGFFRHLDRVAAGEERDPTSSHVRLLATREPSPSPVILVLDPQIADQWHISSHEILVWGAISLTTAVPFAGLSGNKRQLANDITLPDEVEAWEPKMFFTEKLFVIGQEDAFPGSLKMDGAEVLRYQHQQVTPILPLDQVLIENLSSAEIADRISFEQTTDGILVRLRLPLAGPDLNGKDFEVRRQYSAQDNEIVLLDRVPVLEVWPNFIVTNLEWKAYYVYWSSAGARNTFEAVPFAPGAEVIPRSAKGAKRVVSRMNRFPEAMLCTAFVANPQSHRMEAKPAGVLLIAKPESLTVEDKQIKIGIDFGATGTSVFARQGTRFFPVVFHNHFLTITGASNVDRAELYDFFLPPEDPPWPFLSIFQDFLVAGDKELRPLLDGRILFLGRGESGFDARADGVAVDLKWSNKGEDRVRVTAFLEQLALQIGAEIVSARTSQVEWAYSYPTAFPVAKKVGFPQLWSAVTKACSEMTGLGQIGGSPTSKTESVASATFFREHPDVKAPTNIGAICVDIGGSTSDIAIWQDKLCWQTSLLLGGRDLFLNFLHANPTFLKMFGIDTTKLQDIRDHGDRVAFYAQADSIISRESKNIFKVLFNFAGQKEVQQLARALALGISGLFFYVGSLLKYLIDNNRYRKESPNIYIGGNGSQMFHWLDAGEYNERSSISQLFKMVFLSAAGLGKEEIVDIKISPLPKAEAAWGLVCATDLSSDWNSSEGVLAGERFRENGTEQEWTELLTADRLTKDIEVPASLERLKVFLNVFNSYARETHIIQPVSINEELLRKIRGRLATSISELRGRDDEMINVEPIFILALKHLLEIEMAP